MEQVKETVTANERADNPNRMTADETALVITHKGGEQEKLFFRTDFKLADKQADESARRLYQYMEAIGRSGCVMYGHQNDITHKAGAKELSFSDTGDVTGDYPAVFGIDVLSLTGNEFTAERYNREFAGREGVPEGAVDIGALGSAYANVAAAARLTNYMLTLGGVVSLSAHMPNFSRTMIKEEGSAFPQTYAKYDFNCYTPDVTDGGVAAGIVPGGAYNEVYRAYLDMVADYVALLDGPIMFRPFHENTGSWFWWGERHCTPEEFKEAYRYTVSYLRDTKQLHNLLYVYSPGSEPDSAAEFETRYPGDDWVDMVGFDMYDRFLDLGREEEFMSDFSAQLAILEEFSARHDKLMAVTETGLAAIRADEGDSATALHRSGNKNPHWYADILERTAATKASYFLLWANFGAHRSFYAPYVEKVDAHGNLCGHELLDDYIRYYNDSRSVFAGMQKEAVSRFQGKGRREL